MLRNHRSSHVFFVFLILQLVCVYLSLSGAQITFTREWLAGKRSSGGGRPFLSDEGKLSFCKSLVPAITAGWHVERLYAELSCPYTSPSSHGVATGGFLRTPSSVTSRSKPYEEEGQGSSAEHLHQYHGHGGSGTLTSGAA